MSPDYIPDWPIVRGEELEFAVKVLRVLHPKHDLPYKSICVTCAQIQALEHRVEELTPKR